MTSPLLAAKKRKRSKITKKSKKRFSYEYMMKSCLTWEYADIFSNIESWDESLKGHADKGVIESELCEMKNVKENEQVSRQVENLDSQSLEDCSTNEQVQRST